MPPKASTRPTQGSVFPLPYYLFFLLVEPGLTLAGAAHALFSPTTYARKILKTTAESVIEKSVGGFELAQEVGSAVEMPEWESTRAQILTGGLGNCFFLLAIISLSLLPIFNSADLRRNNPALQEKLIKGLLIPLAIADLTHIFFTLKPLPPHVLYAPFTQWTPVFWANIWITAVLFIVRCMWLSGIGRLTPKSVAGKKNA